MTFLADLPTPPNEWMMNLIYGIVALCIIAGVMVGLLVGIKQLREKSPPPPKDLPQPFAISKQPRMATYDELEQVRHACETHRQHFITEHRDLTAKMERLFENNAHLAEERAVKAHNRINDLGQAIAELTGFVRAKLENRKA